MSSLIKNNIDVLMVLETKLHSTFPQSRFITEGYAPPFRYCKSASGGSILLFVREDVLARENQNDTFKRF